MRLGVSPVQLVVGADIIVYFWVDGPDCRRVVGGCGFTDFPLHFFIIHIHTGVTDVADCNSKHIFINFLNTVVLYPR